MPPLVAFDLDGTLIDSRQDLADSANAMLGAYGAPSLDTDIVAGMVGHGARQLVANVLAAAKIETDVAAALDRFLSIYSERLLIHTCLYPGVPDLLARLSGHVSLAVLTNKPEALSRRILDGLGVSTFFPWVVGGDSGHPRKPDPASLRALMATVNSRPAETLYVGDSMVDVETGRSAGVHVIVAGYGFGHLGQPLSLRAGERLAASAADVGGAVAEILGLP